MDYPEVSIVILNWNGWVDTIECLESVYQINYPNYNIIVVDNASEDYSLRKIKEYCSGQLEVNSDFFEYRNDNKPINVFEYDLIAYDSYEKHKINDLQKNHLFLIKNDENSGFPGGNNIGITFALNNLKPDYILLLNNDVVVDASFLEELVKFGELDKKIGILGPKIYYYNNPDVIWSAGCKISWKLSRGIQIGRGEVDQGQYDELKEIEYVSGSGFLIKTDVINKIGMMDETYFLYFEESDWTLKANQAGYNSMYVPEAKVWHKVSRSGGGMYKPIGLYYITRNRWIFMRKWAKIGDYFFFIIYQFIGVLLVPLFLSLYYQDRMLFLAYYRGFYDGIKF